MSSVQWWPGCRVIVVLILTAVVVGCSEPESVPMGDDLDQLLNEVTSQDVFDELLMDCLLEAGQSTAQWEAYVQATRSNSENDNVNIDPEPVTESGLVAEALDEARGTNDGAEIPALSPSLLQALQGEVGGEQGGCLRIAEDRRARTPSEQARIVLQRRYFEEITPRVSLDPSIQQAYGRWARCMADAGFDGLGRPGEHFALIERKIEEAQGDIGALEQVRVFDQALTSANLGCLDSSEVRSTHSAVRAAYDRTFVEENREEIEQLLLLVQEQKNKAGSG